MPSKKIKILFIADIVGRAGRRTVSEILPSLIKEEKIDFVIANGENMNPPSHAPKIAGAPAINPKPNNFPIIGFPLAIGAAIAKPSDVLCNAKPTIKNVLNAISPRPTEAPIAKPSPKLCKPIPIAIIKPKATGFE